MPESGTLVRPEPLPENAPAVIVPVVLIAVEPPMVPEVMALPETLPAVEMVFSAESGMAERVLFAPEIDLLVNV